LERTEIAENVSSACGIVSAAVIAMTVVLFGIRDKAQRAKANFKTV